jgi:hypothetical protein
MSFAINLYFYIVKKNQIKNNPRRKSTLLFLFFLLSTFSTLKAQPWNEFTYIRGVSLNATDLVGGFATLSYTYNPKKRMDHRTLSVGYMIFDGILPEYYLGLKEPEYPLHRFKFGYTLSLASTKHIFIGTKLNWVWGHNIRMIFRKNADEKSFQSQFLFSFGYHHYFTRNILFYPSIQMGLSNHTSIQGFRVYRHYNSYNLMAALNLNVGYMF